jgi:MFS family permease
MQGTRYGWLNIIVGALLMVATMPGRTQGMGLITKPLLRDLGMGDVSYATINLAATLIGAALCFPAGYLMDRVGLRFVSVSLVIVLGGTVLLLSDYSGGAAGLLLLMTMTRGFGQSGLSVASITTVTKTAGGNLGLSVGIYSALLTLFFVAAFTIVGHEIQAHGWRYAWLSIGLFLLFVIAPFTFLFLREARSDPTAGHQDQKPTPEQGEGNTAAGHTLSQAMRTPAFWIFGLSVSLYGLVSSGLGLFNQAVLEERGFDASAYYRFLSVTTAISLIGQLGCGWLALSQSLPKLLGIALFIYAVALAMLPFVTTFTQLWIFAGFSGGFIAVLFYAIWRHAFGAAHVGRIQGAAQFLTVLTSAVGPLVFASCHSWAGSYAPLLLGISAIVLLMGILAFRLSLPKRP